MRSRLAAATLAAALAAPAMAQDDTLPEVPTRGELFVAAALVVPIALYAIGEMWDAACTASGFEFRQNESGDWICTGFPGGNRG